MRDFARYVILAPLKPAGAPATNGVSRQVAAIDADDRTPMRIGADATDAADPSPARFASAVATHSGACP